MEIQCGPCNDGICDWMPCYAPVGCICRCTPPSTTDQGSEMATPTKKAVKEVVKEEVGATLEEAAETLVNEGVTFEYEGHSYSVPKGKEWPLEVVEAQEAGKMLGFVKALIGDDDYKAMRRSCKTTSDLNDFLDAMFGALDLDPGK